MHIHLRLHGHRCLNALNISRRNWIRQLFFLRQIVASYILQRGVFVLIVSSSSGDLEVTAIYWGLLGLCRVFSPPRVRFVLFFSLSSQVFFRLNAPFSFLGWLA